MDDRDDFGDDETTVRGTWGKPNIHKILTSNA